MDKREAASWFMHLLLLNGADFETLDLYGYDPKNLFTDTRNEYPHEQG